jgi:hypothetical protein
MYLFWLDAAKPLILSRFGFQPCPDMWCLESRLHDIDDGRLLHRSFRMVYPISFHFISVRQVGEILCKDFEGDLRV